MCLAYCHGHIPLRQLCSEHMISIGHGSPLSLLSEIAEAMLPHTELFVDCDMLTYPGFTHHTHARVQRLLHLLS